MLDIPCWILDIQFLEKPEHRSESDVCGLTSDVCGLILTYSPVSTIPAIRKPAISIILQSASLPCPPVVR